MTPAIDYLNPDLPPDLRIVPMPVVDATAESLEGYGRLVTRPENFNVEIVRWPATGWRPVDADTGDEAGTTEGIFVSEWRGDVLYGRNDAVGGKYILAYATEPHLAKEDHQRPPERHARLRLEALEAERKQFEGTGTVRTLAPGSTFTLLDHPETRARTWAAIAPPSRASICCWARTASAPARSTPTAPAATTRRILTGRRTSSGTSTDSSRGRAKAGTSRRSSTGTARLRSATPC